jgi:hypothetical protein
MGDDLAHLAIVDRGKLSRACPSISVKRALSRSPIAAASMSGGRPGWEGSSTRAVIAVT